MHMLVTAASKHGSTWGIAEAVAEELEQQGLTVTFVEPAEVRDIHGYDAVVLGSAVYMGNWMPEARHFVERHQDQLTHIPVWLFSSGPLGDDDPLPHGVPERAVDLIHTLRPREHHVFVGKLDRHTLGFAERLAVKAVHAPEGDFRDWADIRAWARAIAGEMSQTAARL